jgi:hypothetical protein
VPVVGPVITAADRGILDDVAACRLLSRYADLVERDALCPQVLDELDGGISDDADADDQGHRDDDDHATPIGLGLASLIDISGGHRVTPMVSGIIFPAVGE